LLLAITVKKQIDHLGGYVVMVFQ